MYRALVTFALLTLKLTMAIANARYLASYGEKKFLITECHICNPFSGTFRGLYIGPFAKLKNVKDYMY